MVDLRLPTSLRTNRGYHKIRCGVGGEIPAWFAANIKSIDKDLYFVKHKYKTMWDDPVINCYEGDVDDPRFHIHEEYGEEVWGFPCKKAQSDEPIPDGTIHLWRLCWPYGWAHVVQLESLEPEYLSIVERRLHLQAVLSDKYDQRAYTRMNEEEKEALIARRQEQADDLYNEVQKENSWLMQRAMNNFERGITKATNPTKEIITSFSNQSNKSKIVRPITDTEGGLVLPDSWD